MKIDLTGPSFQKSEVPEFYVYIWHRNDGTPFYVGAGKNSRYKSYQRRNSHTLNIVKKLGGMMQFQKSIIAVQDIEHAFNLEKQLIKKFGRKDLGTGCLSNKTDGGEGTTNKIVSKKTKKSVTEANKKREWSQQTRKRMSESLKGREVKESTRDKLRTAFIGKKRPDHVMKALRAGHLKSIEEGRHNTEARQKAFKEIVQPAAAAWHSSEDGRKFHEKLSKESWKKRKGTEMECHFCGQKFTTPFPTQAKYCHANCKASALRARRGMSVGTRPYSRKTVKPRSWPR